jgi:hypothetical protein
MSDLTPAEAKAIAGEAWLYAFAPVALYNTMYAQAIDPASPSFVGGFNRFRHYDRLATPDDKDIVTPNNDTPYSWAWLDLRAEPMVLSLPAVAERYYVNQWFDLYTHNFAYTGTRTTGTGAGHYLFAGPDWQGEVPAGITGVFRAETRIIGTLTRTAVDGADDIPAMKAVQAQYGLQPLSAFAGMVAPAAAAMPDWPVWDEARAKGLGFIAYLNTLLAFMPVVPSEVAMLERFAGIGIGAGRAFDEAGRDARRDWRGGGGVSGQGGEGNQFGGAVRNARRAGGGLHLQPQLRRGAGHSWQHQGRSDLCQPADRAGWHHARWSP